MNIDPATGKRRYRKRKTKEQQLQESGVDGLSFLRRCGKCTKVRDRDELFEFPYSIECLLCTRKRERIREGLAEQSLAKTTREKRAAGNRAAAKRLKEEKAERYRQFMGWSEQRRTELEGTVKPWEVYACLLKEAPTVRERLGLPPSPNPQSSI